MPKLLRFTSTKSDGKQTSLDKYLDRMQETREMIYHMTGDLREVIQKAPELQILNKKVLDELRVEEHGPAAGDPGELLLEHVAAKQSQSRNGEGMAQEDYKADYDMQENQESIHYRPGDAMEWMQKTPEESEANKSQSHKGEG